MSDIASRRKDYESAGLDVAEVDADPMAQWQQWYDQASSAGCVEPNAFTWGLEAVRFFEAHSKR